MPVVLRVRGYRFWFYSADLVEPPHVHVGKAGNEAKYWIAPIGLAKTRGFRDHELADIERIIRTHQDQLLAAWRAAEAGHDDN